MTRWDWKHSLSELQYKKEEKHCVKKPKEKGRNEKGGKRLLKLHTSSFFY